MTNSTVLSDALSRVLARAGFQARGDTWYRDAHVGLQAVELQKSEWGDQYYLNVGVYVRDLGKVRWPKTYQCHLNVRADVIDVRQQDLWREVLDLESQLDANGRGEELQALLTSQVLPLLDSLRTAEGIRDAYLKGALSHAAVMLTLKQALALP